MPETQAEPGVWKWLVVDMVKRNGFALVEQRILKEMFPSPDDIQQAFSALVQFNAYSLENQIEFFCSQHGLKSHTDLLSGNVTFYPLSESHA